MIGILWSLFSLSCVRWWCLWCAAVLGGGSRPPGSKQQHQRRVHTRLVHLDQSAMFQTSRLCRRSSDFPILWRRVAAGKVPWTRMLGEGTEGTEGTEGLEGLEGTEGMKELEQIWTRQKRSVFKHPLDYRFVQIYIEHIEVEVLRCFEGRGSQWFM